MAKDLISITKDLSLFEDRVDEITSATSFEAIKHVVARLKRALNQDKDLVALCAPQIGEYFRIFGVKTADGNVKIFLNPIIVNGKGLHLSREINASMPNKQFIIPRKNEIHVAYQEINGKANSESYTGVYAEVVQQMIEMLDGILLSDYGLDLDDVGGSDAFDSATKKDKETIIQMYIESLKSISDDLKVEIENNPDLKEINDNIEFLTGVLKGDIKPVDKEGHIVESKKEENK